MSKIDKDLKESKKYDKSTKQAVKKLEEYQYGDWKALQN